MNVDVVISGGGLVGSTLAALLSQAGIHCLVLEPRDNKNIKKTGVDPRALTITPASKHILDAIGAWKHLPADRIGRFTNMCVWDENGNGKVEFENEHTGQDCLGYVVEQSLLQNSLDKITEYYPGITVDHHNRIEAINNNDETISVSLTDGTCINASLLIAADGLNSPTRELAGITYKRHDYHQQAVACIVQTSLPHEYTARQRFLTNGPLAFLPMAGTQQCGVVWSTTPQRAQELLAMDDVTFRKELGAAFEYTLGEILHVESRSAFPLGRAQAESYCKERFVLAGDAAHCIHPLAGQGANMGFLDAASLAEVMITAKNKHRDIGSITVLRRYERWRKGENHLMMMVMEGFKYLFENQSNAFKTLRNTGMNLFNAVPLAKNIIMRRAMGLEGDLPEIAR